MEVEHIRVILVDDHAMIRDGLIAILKSHFSCEILAEIENGNDAVAVITQTQADLVIMDIGLPGKNGLDVLCEIRGAGVKTPVLIFTMNKNLALFKKAEQATAQGFLLKNDAREYLVKAVKVIAAGGRYYSPEIEVLVSGNLTTPAEGLDPRVVLTRQEYDIFSLIAQGLTTKSIAEKKCVSSRTVEYHRCNINKKLGTSRVQDVIRVAQDFGLV